MSLNMTRSIFSILMAIIITMMILFIQLIGNYRNNSVVDAQLQQPRYHLQIFVRDSQGYSADEFKKGANMAAETYNVFVEFVEYSENDTELLAKLADQAIYSSVNGVAMQIDDTKLYKEVVGKLLESQVSVVAYESEYYAERIITESGFEEAHVVQTAGSNSHNLGALAGELALSAADGDVSAAVILSMATEEDDYLYRNNIILGIQSAFDDYEDSIGHVTTVYNQGNDLFQAEKIMREILDEHPDINTVICFDEQYTPAITQVLVDDNKIGDINVIGYGILPQTLNYIQRDVIYGTICPDSYGIGYDTVESLVEALEGITVSDTKYRQAAKVTNANVDDYLAQ